MARYEVELQIAAATWVDVQADSEEEAERHARDSWQVSDLQWFEITDVSVKKYWHEDTAPC